MALSPDDDAVLSRIGLSYLFNLAQICPLLILYGAFIVLFPYSLFIVCQKPRRTSASHWLIALTTILFICETIYVASYIAFQVLEYQIELIGPREPLEFRREVLAEQLAPLSQLQDVVPNIIFIIADAIVLWRAWVLYAHNRVVQGFIIFVALINTMLMIVDIVITSVDAVNQSLGVSASSGINSATYFFSFVANLGATLLIAYRLWKVRHRQEMRDLYYSRQKGTKIEKILVLIIESGLGLCAMQLINATVPIVGQNSDSRSITLLNDAWYNMTISVAALYPALLIIIVSQQNASVVDSTIALGGSSETVAAHARRAHGADKPTSTLRFATVQSSELASSAGGTREDTTLASRSGTRTDVSRETHSMV